MSFRLKLIVHILLAVQLFICFIIACSGRSSSTGPSGENSIEALVTETIGTEGGTVQTDGFLLTIPQGAFDSSNEISVYSDTTEVSSDPNAVTKEYEVEGLPDNYNRGLRLALAYEGTLEDESYIEYGFWTEDVVTGDTTLIYNLLSVQDSSGYLVCILEPKTGQTAVGKNSKNTIQNGDDNWNPYSHIFTIGLTGLRTLESNHFSFEYPGFIHSRMGGLINILESHYTKIADGQGFELDEIGWQFPINVIVKYNVERDQTLSIYSTDLGKVTMNIHSWLLESDVDIPNLAVWTGQRLFGLVLHDYKAERTVDYIWLTTAVTEWSEEIFTVSDDYEKPANFHNYLIMRPFVGMRAGAGNFMQTSETHGWGMSPVIKYLVDDIRFGSAGLVGTFEDIWVGESSVYALMNNVQALAADWWPDFYAKYISGNVYNVPASEFTDPENVSGTWQIDDGTKITHTFKSSEFGLYPDLSAKLFRINVPYTGLDDNINLSLQTMGELNSDGLALLVFSINNGSLNLLNTPGSYSSGYVIQDLKDKVDNGMDQFLICVVNNQLYPPYNNTYDIDLQCTLTEQQQDPGYYECGLLIDIGTTIDYTTPDTSYTRESDETTISMGGFCPGSFSGNTFSGSYSTTLGESVISGTVTAVFSPDYRTITNLEWSESRAYSTSTLVAVDIPFDYGYWGTDIFQIQGEQICDHVVTLSYTQSVADGLSFSLRDYNCNWSSRIWMSFEFEDEIN